MTSFLEFVSVPAREALLFIPVAYGVFISFRILRFPDLAVDNTFALGALVGAASAGYSQSTLVVCVCVGLAGAATGAVMSSLFTIARVSKLLSSIMVYSILFSLNLRIFNRPNVPFPAWGEVRPWFGTIVGLLTILAMLLLLSATLGKTLIAYGNNPRVAAEFGINRHLVSAIGLALANALVALSGFTTAQAFGFADVGLGAGTLLHAVAAIIIGTAVIRGTSFHARIFAIAVGLLLYSVMLFAATVYLSDILRPSDVKLFSSILVIAIVVALRHRQEELFEF